MLVLFIYIQSESVNVSAGAGCVCNNYGNLYNRISAVSCQDLKNWNLLQSDQALGIMTVAGKFSNADAYCLPIGITSSKTKCVRLRNGRSLQRSLQHPKQISARAIVDATGRTILVLCIVCTRNCVV